MINLQQFKAAVLDMDGVITQTAKVHARAWKLLFDEFLEEHNQREGETQKPFNIVSDYRRHVDGKPRYDGVRSFLDARHISVPEGSPDDSPDQETICGLGNRKNRKFLELLEQQGVELYEDAIEVIHKWKAAGLRVAVISSSRNCQAVLRAGGVLDLFDAKLDGNDLEERGIRGKPAPDMFLEAAAELKATPPSTIIVEDAEAGVRAGHAGHFGLVVGVAREHGRSGLKQAGADMVVRNLRVLIEEKRPALSAMEEQERLAREIGDRSITLFLDYDGTLTPIVRRPEEALLSGEARRLLRELARHCTVAVVSGRDRLDVENMVALQGLIYAGSHGFDIRGPDLQMQHDKAKVALPELDQAQETISRRLQKIEGARVERKAFALAVHYREVRNDAAVEEIRAAVEAARQRHSSLRMMEGKKLFELQPDVDWNKGRAVQWLCELLGKRPSESAIFYIGDDVTDEDAFRVIAEEQLGIGIRVADDGASTCAPYYLRDPQEVKRFLEFLLSLAEKSPPERGERNALSRQDHASEQSSARAAEKETESPGDESTTWTLT